jgi:DNA adenine methylase
MKPIIKWVGGKSSSIHKIKELMPAEYNHYYEPFFGGGSVLLNLIEGPATVSDINPELINVYRQINLNPEEVIAALENIDYIHNTSSDPKKYYYTVREYFNARLGSNSIEQAARFIYLNKHCFNGLYRVNSKGQFNVPFNGKVSGASFDPDNIRKVSDRLHTVDLLCCDFADTVKDAAAGDLIYFDPPYAPLTPTSFVDYTKEGFSYEDHVRLAELFKELTDRGVYCMLANHDTELIRELYKDYNITEIDVRRSINRNGDNRKGKEVIITNY